MIFKSKTSYDHLSASEIDVWVVPLNKFFEQCETWENFLDANELSRAQRFKFENDRRSFIAAHGALRIILSRYLKCLPEEVGLDYAASGKPFLLADESIQFSLSHSDEYTLVAIASHISLGIDIEKIREIKNRDEIAKRFFTQDEIDQYFQTPPEKRLLTFYEAWTSKEAIIKEAGLGVFHNHKQNKTATHLVHFQPSQNYQAAIAWNGPEKSLNYFLFD